MLKLMVKAGNGRNFPIGKANNDAEMMMLLQSTFDKSKPIDPSSLYISEDVEGEDERTYEIASWLIKQLPDIANYIGLIVRDIQQLDIRIKALDTQLNPKPVEETPEPK